ncbi:hypothetical protein MAR_000648 [Mya arenaria]|uniref:Uncharacterized protein n=2 Tax=Mya arenaria TaxID=6604 RepID=A0ABY7F9L9_MYAAR|nr:hypothetical protein MAR_000648 [Mya arenaria]
MSSDTCPLETGCTCGGGVSGRNRSCDNPATQFDGTPCDGSEIEAKNCFVPCFENKCSAENPSGCQVVLPADSTQENNGVMVDGEAVAVLCAVIVALWLADKGSDVIT